MQVISLFVHTTLPPLPPALKSLPLSLCTNAAYAWGSECKKFHSFYNSIKFYDGLLWHISTPLVYAYTSGWCICRCAYAWKQCAQMLKAFHYFLGDSVSMTKCASSHHGSPWFPPASHTQLPISVLKSCPPTHAAGLYTTTDTCKYWRKLHIFEGSHISSFTNTLEGCESLSLAINDAGWGFSGRMKVQTGVTRQAG